MAVSHALSMRTQPLGRCYLLLAHSVQLQLWAHVTHNVSTLLVAHATSIVVDKDDCVLQGHAKLNMGDYSLTYARAELRDSVCCHFPYLEMFL